MYRGEFTPTQDKYRTAKWRGSEIDKSVAYTNVPKTYSVNKSTDAGSKSPYKSMAVSRLEDAKKTIDEVIVDLSEKRDMNDEALREVRSVNSEIIEDYRRNHPFESKVNLLNASTAYAPEPKSVNASTFDLRAPPQDDSLLLRSRLNDELRKNNELMARLSRVEEENRLMKREYQMSFGPGAENGQLRA